MIGVVNSAASLLSTEELLRERSEKRAHQRARFGNQGQHVEKPARDVLKLLVRRFAAWAKNNRN